MNQPLSVNVYVAPMRPFVGAAGEGGDQPMWSPMSSTLIAGREDAILVDTLVTFGQVDELAEWARGFGKRITGVYITHGHSDHWIGLARLQEHFPEARGIATPEVVGRATFEATDPGLSAYWKASFPGELPETAVLPEALTAGRCPSARETPSSPLSCTCRPPPPWSAATSSTTACT
jgi:glyoxylase-like metal-dependent hydrolase (beta-lactamase superfamily II)